MTLRVSRADQLGYDKLVQAIIGLAQDNARAKLTPATITKQTDSTTGTAASTVAAITIPAAFVHVSGSDLAPKAGFDTAIGKLSNCANSLAAFINPYRATLGLQPVALAGVGTITAALPALDKTLSGVDGTGTNAVDASTGRTQLSKARDNLATLTLACNEIAYALGMDTITDASGGAVYKSSGVLTLQSSASTASGVNGATATPSLSDTATDTALTALAAGYASLSYFINWALDHDAAQNLTDNSTGTASTALPPVIEAIDTAPATYQDVSTASAPHAGVNTALGVINTNMSDLTKKINELARFNEGIAELTDSTGGSPDYTLAAVTTNQTAVNGTGSNSLSNALIRPILVKVANNFATLTAKVNELSPIYGLPVLTDSSSGTASTTGTVVALGTSASGVDNSAAATGVADTVMDAILVAITNNLATLAARLNAMDNADNTRPLAVVAKY